MLLDALHLPGAAVAATGAEGLLGATRLWVRGWAALPGASLAVTRPEVATALVGAAGGWLLARRHLRVGRSVRALVVAAGVAVASLAWPVSRHALRSGSLEVHMLDVGQGDAFALRTPAGRWVVIDAGPPPGRRLVEDLRRLGARSIELLLLSHPDADHVGGASPLLAGLRVRGVAGPGTIRGSGPWQDAVGSALEAEVPWRVLTRGDDFALDGVAFRLLHPGPGGPAGRPFGITDAPGTPARAVDPNAASLVVEAEWRGVRFLFMGDAPAEVERAVVVEPLVVDVLKVGHHGSLTSSDRGFLESTLPSVALLSVGRGNRYGHPASEVLERLESIGAEVWRTDVSGSVVVRVSRAGEVSVTDRR
jgi:competence protein ComEC